MVVAPIRLDLWLRDIAITEPCVDKLREISVVRTGSVLGDEGVQLQRIDTFRHGSILQHRGNGEVR